jgi:hypothetical protein
MKNLKPLYGVRANNKRFTLTTFIIYYNGRLWPLKLGKKKKFKILFWKAKLLLFRDDMIYTDNSKESLKKY